MLKKLYDKVEEHTHRERSTPVVARYTRTTTQSIASGSYQIVNYATQVIDPFSLVTVGASWLFDCQLSGYYLVYANAVLENNTGWNAGEVGSLALHKNGTLYSVLDYHDDLKEFGTGLELSLCGGDIIELEDGDYIDVRVYQDSGGAINIQADGTLSYINIARIN